MKTNKLRLTVTLARTTEKRIQKFFGKTGGLLMLVCPGTTTSFDTKRRRLTVTGIRTLHGLHLAQTVVIALAEGMEIALIYSDFDIHHIGS